MSKQIVIYHADCLDGLGSAWVAYRQFHDSARYVPARYGDPFPDLDIGDTIFILDFSYPPDVMAAAGGKAEKILLLDHHQTALSEYDTYLINHSLPANVTARFSQEFSGCVMAWHTFEGERNVPMILQHIQDRDLWKFELPGTREITTALYNRLPISLSEFGSIDLDELSKEGTLQVKLVDRAISRLLKGRHRVKLAGVEGLAVNAPAMYSSELGHELAKLSGTFGMTYHFAGERGQWICSLRSIGDLDVGTMAKQFGGGGHHNAAGFKLAHSEFLLFIGDAKPEKSISH
jgi:nanoRNase/pAp phosphatase (c-di-AMP/oligoRNAs hydrolase)